jgi:hypothetical protein
MTFSGMSCLRNVPSPVSVPAIADVSGEFVDKPAPSAQQPERRTVLTQVEALRALAQAKELDAVPALIGKALAEPLQMLRDLAPPGVPIPQNLLGVEMTFAELALIPSDAEQDELMQLAHKRLRDNLRPALTIIRVFEDLLQLPSNEEEFVSLRFERVKSRLWLAGHMAKGK